MKKKQEVDNKTIQSKYQIARSKLKERVERLVKATKKEIDKLEKMKGKYSFNESNEKLLNERMGLLVSFKTELIDSWEDTLKKKEY